jgi:ribose 5-phosphate isomerase
MRLSDNDRFLNLGFVCVSVQSTSYLTLANITVTDHEIIKSAHMDVLIDGALRNSAVALSRIDVIM